MSSALHLPRSAGHARPIRVGRWIAILVVSVLVHLAALDVLPHWTIDTVDDVPEHEPLRAVLMPPISTPPAAAAPATPAPAAPKPRVIRREPLLPAVATPFVPESVEPPQQVTATEGSAPKPPVPVVPAPPEPAPAPLPAPTPPATTPPRPARLDYTVVSQNVKESNPIYGKGTITWAIANGRYSADLTAAAELFVFRFDVLSSHSEGIVGAGGLAPDRYTESPRRKSMVATNFNRDARQSITFSASSASVPLVAGAQDRLSVLFQIGALLVADPAKATADRSIEIPVAGVRGDVEAWRFEFRGSEPIETGAGTLSTTHLQRAPRPGTNDRTIDVWVAQSDGGYPARVLYTEPSGNSVMMTLDGIAPMP
jgi:hypothetical protein